MPHMFHTFEKEFIETHANECADTYLSNVDAKIMQNKAEDENVAHAITALKGEIKAKEPLLVTVRRKHIWKDFKRARNRYYNPTQYLKVTFSGEPAIDA